MPVKRSTSCNGTYSRMSNFPNIQVKNSPEGLTRTLASSPRTLHDQRRRPQKIVIFIEDRQHSADAPHKTHNVLTHLELRRTAHNAARPFKKHDLPILHSSLRVSTERNLWSSMYKHHRVLQGTCLGLGDPPLCLRFCQSK